MIPPSINQLMKPEHNWLIITDLDGTLLDHFNYNHQAVDSLLLNLEESNIPVVFNSSKTIEEMIDLRREFNNQHPFIVENGSAIFIPEHYFDVPISEYTLQEIEGENYYVIELGKKLSDIQSFLTEYDQGNRLFKSFSESSDQEIVDMTSLPIDKVKKSKLRRYSEPLLWLSSEENKQRFRSIADTQFNTLQGGRFLHILGQCDKGLATRKLKSVFQSYSKPNRPWHCVALGDGDNDVEMLQSAEIAAVIRSPTHSPPTIPNHNHVTISKACGPEGWNEIISTLFLEKLYLKELS